MMMTVSSAELVMRSTTLSLQMVAAPPLVESLIVVVLLQIMLQLVLGCRMRLKCLDASFQTAQEPRTRLNRLNGISVICDVVGVWRFRVQHLWVYFCRIRGIRPLKSSTR